MGEPEDSDLLAAMAGGDEAAFGILLERYEKWSSTGSCGSSATGMKRPT